MRGVRRCRGDIISTAKSIWRENRTDVRRVQVSKLLNYAFQEGGVEKERAGIVMVCDGGEGEMVGLK